MNTNKTLQELKFSGKFDRIGTAFILIGTLLCLLSCFELGGSEFFFPAVVFLWLSFAVSLLGFGFIYIATRLMNKRIAKLNTDIIRLDDNIKKMEKAGEMLDKLNLLLIRENTLLMLKGELDTDQKQTIKRLRLTTFDMN